MDEVEVDDDALVGPDGAGASVMFDALNTERLLVAAMALGLGEYALGKAVAYARERAPFGRPIGAYQGVQHRLARAKAHLEAARGAESGIRTRTSLRTTVFECVYAPYAVVR